MPRAQISDRGLLDRVETVNVGCNTNRMEKRKGKKAVSRETKYTDRLPIVIQAPIAYHNPVSVLYGLILYLCSRRYSFGYDGVLNEETRSVQVRDSAGMEQLWARGFFGKGSLSRSEPSFRIRRMRQLGLVGLDEGLTSEEITAARRRERSVMKKLKAGRPDEGDRVSQNTLAHVSPVPQDSLATVSFDAEYLQLTLEEAFFLSYVLGVLKIRFSDSGSELHPDSLLHRFARLYTPGQSVQPDNPFILQYVVYHHFRSLGWVVRSGIKFAVDYLLYKRGPPFSHAVFAVILLPYYQDGRPASTLDWHTFHAINRVQGQVKKTVIVVYVIIPVGLCLDSTMSATRILKSYKVRQVSIQRWVSSRNRG